MHLTTRLYSFLSILLILFLLISCNSNTESEQTSKTGSKMEEIQPTVAEAEAFIKQAEINLTDLLINMERTQWIQSNFITADTSIVSSRAIRDITAESVRLANQSKRFSSIELPAELSRKMNLLKLALTLPAPMDSAKTAELADITAYLNGAYGEGKYCPSGSTMACKGLGELSRIIAESSDPQQLLEAWAGWRTISPPMKKSYTKMVILANEGARELGYKDLGAMWRSKYDMPADDFANEMDRLWGEVKPLYESLHCYVRGKLNEKYGDDIVTDSGTIPAHLLGNMWAQSWDNLYQTVKPESKTKAIDLTAVLNQQGYPDFDGLNKKGRLATAKKMVRTAENFFVSLGFKPLPDSFWERSLFIKPEDREVVCHASAWDVDQQQDLRIKMCIKSDAEDFATIHHELGHNFYQRAYKDQSPLFRNSANDGFHEAAGDLIALSITPSYLKKINLIDEVPSEQDPVPELMKQALAKVAFLPFGLMVDKWRWQVFSGEVDEQHYNQAWWKLRETYQGIHAPITRLEDAFDPGAKYHIPGNTPYARYFLAHILQFQWHRDLCRASGYEGPLHECSIYGDKQAGEKIKKMFTMGMSRPWPEALEIISGTDKMDATSVTEYFAPLKVYLDQQNEGKTCGW